MKRLYKYLFLCAFLVFGFPPLITSAHPGGTDENGGHYNRSTGEYHYHHGYSAHQHTNGECPYDFDDKTSSGSTTYHNTSKIAPQNSKKNDIEEKSQTYSSALQVTEKSEVTYGAKEKTASYLMAWLVIIILTILGTVPAFCTVITNISENIRRKLKNKTEHQTLLPKKSDNAKEISEYDYYFKLYAFYDPSSFVEMPNGTYIRNLLPVTDGKAYGKYTVYITTYGTKYHKNPRCSNTKMIQKNAAYVVNRYAPCLKCVKHPIPSLTWYKEYLRIVRIKNKYNIP